MSRETLELFDTFGRMLVYASGVVALFAFVGAITILTSESALPLVQDIQQEGRPIFAVGALGAGIAGAALVAGVGVIVRLLVAEQVYRLDRDGVGEFQVPTTEPGRDHGGRGDPGGDEGDDGAEAIDPVFDRGRGG